VRRATAIFEDTTMAYNRWVQGIASREHATTQVGVAQLMGRQNSPDKPPKPLHPTLDKTPEILGNAILNLTNLRQKVNLALVSNLAQDSKKKNTLLKIQKKISRNLRFLNSFIDDFNSLS
jgi:hypothetical protein